MKSWPAVVSGGVACCGALFLLCLPDDDHPPRSVPANGASAVSPRTPAPVAPSPKPAGAGGGDAPPASVKYRCDRQSCVPDTAGEGSVLFTTPDCGGACRQPAVQTTLPFVAGETLPELALRSGLAERIQEVNMDEQFEWLTGLLGEWERTRKLRANCSHPALGGDAAGLEPLVA
eukprot:Hpha_TRINITY_DN6973_c0_g2::TRINITY_DN6973_c0_g2_i1::g.139450::m.139450